MAKWLEEHTSTTLPLLISVLALGGAGVAVVLAHRGPAAVTASAPTVISVSDRQLKRLGWRNLASGTYSTAGYYLASDGRVFLTGTLEPLYGRIRRRSTAFVLPPAYRPTRTVVEPISVGRSLGTVSLLQSGNVVVSVPTTRPSAVSLDGISFFSHSTPWLPVPVNVLNQYGWTEASPAEGRAGYYKAVDGTIFLTGAVRPYYGRIGRSSTAFVLPAGYRPLRSIVEPVVVGDSSFGTATIIPTGNVVLNLGSKRPRSVSLDGLSFLPSS